jgi:hypothetical protein
MLPSTGKEAADLLASVKLVRRLRAALASESWPTVAGVLEEARAIPLAACCVKEVQAAQDEVGGWVWWWQPQPAPLLRLQLS